MKKPSSTARQKQSSRSRLPKGSHANFCANLRALREQYSWTQEAVGQAVGMSRTYVADLERGRSVPTLAQVDRMARALRVTTVWLIGEPEKNSAGRR